MTNEYASHLANDVPSTPRISAASTRTELQNWLQACDPNGCHTDDLATAEDFTPYTLEEAWQAVREMVA